MNEDTILARWLTGEISDADFKKQMSDADFTAYIKLRKALQLYEHTQTEMPEAVFQNIKSRILKTEQAKHKNIYYKIAISAAAVLILLITLNHLLSPSMFTVETAIGESQKIVLPDGSVAWLEAHSKLSYNKRNWKTNREIKLNGTAYFEVNKGQKFKVVTPNGNVSVLGTKFEVKSISDLFKIVCFEGKVSVHTFQKDFILFAGQSVQKYDHQVQKQLIRYERPDVQSEIIRFTQIPMSYVLQELENQYNIKFYNKGVDTKVLFTGSLPRNNLKLSLDLLSKAMNIKYKQKNKHLIEIES